MTPTKACTVCGEDKPLTDYSPHRDRPDGRQSACKTCRARRLWVLRKLGRYDQRETVQRLAYSRANSQLRHNHSAEFRDLYEQALRAEREAV